MVEEVLQTGSLELIPHSFKEGEKKDDKWYENRKKSIGGSDISSLFDENKYKSILQLFNEKTGRVEAKKVNNKFTAAGTHNEPFILSVYNYYNGDVESCYENHGEGVNQVREVLTYNGYIRNSKFPRLQVELDGFFIDEDGKRVVVECKTMNERSFVYNKKQPPMKYLLQVMACMAIAEADRAVILMLVGGADYHVFEVNRNDAVIAEIKYKVDSFWNDVDMFLETGSAEYVPEVDESKSCEEALQNLYPRSKDNFRNATEEEEKLIKMYAIMNEDHKQLTEDLRGIRNKLKMGIKDGSKISCEGYSASWINHGQGRRFQVRRLND